MYDFKPLKAISLDDLKKKSNNQREPSPKNINDLRKVLSSMIKPPLQPASAGQATNAPKIEPKVETPKKLEEVPEADLLALLGDE